MRIAALLDANLSSTVPIDDPKRELNLSVMQGMHRTMNKIKD